MASESYLSKINKFLGRHTQLIIFFLVLVVLIEVLLIVIQFDQGLEKEISDSSLVQAAYNEKPGDYPVLLQNYEPYVSAQSAVILDNGSKKILFAKNQDLRFSMASTVKIMSALTALEQFAYNDILTVKRDFNEGSLLGFEVGEQIYFDDLLYGLLLPSGNDAAYVLADNYPGGVEAFVKRMNEKAKEYNLNDTHFYDPAGLNDDQNYTTVVDLARISSAALENPTLARVVSTQRKVFTDVSGQRMYDVYNLNKLLGTQGVIGLKTGTTQGAGEVLTTAVRTGDKEYIIVVMKSEDRFTDTQSLLNLIYDNVKYLTPDEIVAN